MHGIALRCKNVRPIVMIVVLTTIVVAESAAQAAVSSGSLMLEVRPGFEMPIGGSARYFGNGGSFEVGITHPFTSSAFYLLGGVEYSFLTTPISESVSVAAARAGGGVRFHIDRSLSVFAYGSGGYYYSTLNDFSAQASDPYFSAGGGLSLSLSPGFGVDFVAQYNTYFGLYGGLGFGIGSAIRLDRSTQTRTKKPTPTLQLLSTHVTAQSSPNPKALLVSGINLKPIFPVFYAYYADHSIGDLVLKNETHSPVSDISVSLYAKEYMDNPIQVNVPGQLAPGSSQKVNIEALFSQKVLEVTEGTKSSANVTLSYQVGGQTYSRQRIVVLDFIGRNGMTWDDTRKAAAFVTAQNPNVLALARGISSYVEAKMTKPMSENMAVAMAIHDALDLYGINYVPSSVTPYAKVSNEPNVIDYLQFPQGTLQYKSGDCSDLSILYAALLESVGIRTAFITIPGHIFIAVDIGLTRAQAQADLIPSDLLIDRDGTEWIPIEATSIHGGFLKAWKLGANEWLQNELQKQAGFYPIEHAWKVYKPVGLPGTPPNIIVPPVAQVFARYSKDTQAYVNLTVQPKIADLEVQAANGNNVSAMNKLGVLYAQWVSSKLAEKEFKTILAKKDYLPAMINLGNVFYLKHDWKGALRYYDKAANIEPHNPVVLLQIAKANVELENFGTAKQSFAQLKQIDPSLAMAYPYLGQGVAGAETRSANVTRQRKEVVWDRE